MVIFFRKGEIMKNEYPEYISEERRPIAPPKDLVQDGQCLFGTFNGPIENMNLLDCKKPAGALLPHKLNFTKFTQWEAFEVQLKEGILVSAVYNVGFAGFSILVFYDKRTEKVSSWTNFVTNGKDPVCSANLINGCKSYLHTKKSDFVLTNNLERGEAHCAAKVEGKPLKENKKGKVKGTKNRGTIEFDLNIKSISPPSVVSIPFGKNKPLYSHKEFFTAEGTFVVNGEALTVDETTTVIIDDHKGYYPFNAHYDWLTTMGKCNIDGEDKYLAINFTQNQSTDEDKYNENILWLEGESCPLPPVTFTHITNTKWLVRDKYDRVNVIFDWSDQHKIVVNALGAIFIKYYLPFGKIKGYVTDNDGKKYILDGMDGIGEDKTTRM